MTTKRCFKCLCDKPLEDFYKHSAMVDGRLGKCKECTKARAFDKARASQPHRVAARAAYSISEKVGQQASRAEKGEPHCE